MKGTVRPLATSTPTPATEIRMRAVSCPACLPLYLPPCLSPSLVAVMLNCLMPRESGYCSEGRKDRPCLKITWKTRLKGGEGGEEDKTRGKKIITPPFLLHLILLFPLSLISFFSLFILFPLSRIPSHPVCYFEILVFKQNFSVYRGNL